MDGASSNTTMMQAMEAHLNAHQIDYDGADNQIICIEHITANTTRCMIVKVSMTEYSDDFDDFYDPVDSQDGVRDVIALVHNIVCSILTRSVSWLLQWYDQAQKWKKMVWWCEGSWVTVALWCKDSVGLGLCYAQEIPYAATSKCYSY